MKKLIGLITILHLTLSGTSQIVYDSVTCLPNSKLKVAIKKLEICKIQEQELTLTRSNVGVLEQKVAVQDSIITQYKGVVKLYKEKEGNYDAMLKNQQKQIANERSISGILSVKLKTARVNKWLYGGSGLIIGVLLGTIIK